MYSASSLLNLSRASSSLVASTKYFSPVRIVYVLSLGSGLLSSLFARTRAYSSRVFRRSSYVPSIKRMAVSSASVVSVCVCLVICFCPFSCVGYLVRRKDKAIARAIVGIAGKPEMTRASLSPQPRFAR